MEGTKVVNSTYDALQYTGNCTRIVLEEYNHSQMTIEIFNIFSDMGFEIGVFSQGAGSVAGTGFDLLYSQTPC